MVPIISFFLCFGVFGQTEIWKVTPAEIEAGDQFGSDIALTDDLIIVGAPGDDDAGEDFGAVYAFDRVTGEQVRKVLPAPGTAVPGFGTKVEAWGNQWLVSSYLSVQQAGARLIDFDNGGNQVALEAATGEVSSLGSSLAISQRFLAVGDRDEGIIWPPENNDGMVSLYERSSGRLIRQFSSSNSQISKLGSGLGMSDNWLVTNGEVGFGGEVPVVFDLETFIEKQRTYYRGQCLFVSGDYALFGSTIFSSEYTTPKLVNLKSGEYLAHYPLGDIREGRILVASAAILGELVLFGAPGDGELGDNSGCLYVCDRLSGEVLKKLTASDGGADALFGSKIRVEGNSVLVSAPGQVADDPEGLRGPALYLFDLTGVNKTVTFDDAALEGRIREALEKPAGEVTTRDLGQLRELDLSGLTIGSLAVLDDAFLLETLDLRGAEIGDLEAGLEVLSHLPLSVIYRDFELPEGESHSDYLVARDWVGIDGPFTQMIEIRSSTVIALDQLGVDLDDEESFNQVAELRRLGVGFRHSGGNFNPIADMGETEISVWSADPSGETDVLFDTATSVDLDGDLVSFLWSFSGGLEDVEGKRVLVRMPAGVTNGTLVVTDNDGAVSQELNFRVTVEGDPVKESLIEKELTSNTRGEVHVAAGSGFVLFGSLESFYASSSGVVRMVNSATGRLSETIVPDDGMMLDYFGADVAVDGGLAVIGAPGDDDKGNRAGSVYVYRVPSCELVRKIYPSGIDDEIDDAEEAFRGQFGRAVAIAGNRIAVSASFFYRGLKNYVSLIELESGETVRLTDPRGAVASKFGESLAMAGDFLLVGSPILNDEQARVFVFDSETGEYLRSLSPPDEVSSADFGAHIDVFEGIAVVGNPSENGNVGCVYVFDCETGEQLSKLVPKSGESDQFFGLAVAISGDQILVGKRGLNSAGESAGRISLFDRISGNLVTEVLDEKNLNLGYSVSAINGVAAIGASQSGYLYRYPGASSEVAFEDAAVEAAVRAALQNPGDAILISDMWELKELVIEGGGMSSLVGLESAVNLEFLDLRGVELLFPEEAFQLLARIKPALSLLPRLVPDGLVLSSKFVEVSLANPGGDTTGVMIFAPPTRPLNLDEMGFDLGNRETLIGLRALQLGGLELTYDGGNLPPVVVLESVETNAKDVYRAGTATVRVNATESFDLDGEVVEFRWIIPDGIEGASGKLWSGEFPIGLTEGGLVVVDGEGGESAEISFSVAVDGLEEGVQEVGFFRAKSDQPVSQFGETLAIKGNLAVVGDSGGGVSYSRSGLAYLFEVSTGELISELKSDSNSVGAYLGDSVAISGDRILIGSPGENPSGTVVVFDSKTGEQLGLVEPFDENGESYLVTEDYFGSSVAASGSHVLVGAPRALNADGPGAAYLLDLETGKTLFRLEADGVDFRNRFGRAVAMNESILAISAYDRVYVFDRWTGEELFELRSGSHVNIGFGVSIALLEDRLVVGAPDEVVGEWERTGSVYVFDPGTGERLVRLVAEEGNDRDGFGSAVAVSEGYLAVGAPGVDDDDGFDVGEIYLFEPVLFREVGSLRPTGDVFISNNGGTLAISGNALMVSAHGAVGVRLFSLDQPIFEVAFDDPGFEAALLSKLAKAEGPIFSTEMAALESLDLFNLDLASLSGLGYARNLEFVDLRGNARLDVGSTLAILDSTVTGYVVRNFARLEAGAVPSGIVEVSLLGEDGTMVVVSARSDWNGVLDLSGFGLDFDRRETLEGLRELGEAGVNVSVGEVDLKPVAVVKRATIAVEDADRNLFEDLVLDGMGSFDIDGEIAAYHWDFEGAVGEFSGDLITVRFPLGITRGTLIVVDDEGLNSGVLSFEVTVMEPPASVVEAISIFPGNVGGPSTRFGQAVALSDEHIFIGSNMASGPNLLEGKLPIRINLRSNSLVMSEIN